MNVALASSRLFAIAVLLTGAACATMSSAQSPGNRGYDLATIDAATRWAFRALSPAVVHRPIIRLGDVVRPLDPNMAGWQRIRNATIGLAPLDGKPMTIQRERLAQAIYNAEATPRAIDWIGPSLIQVEYRAVTNSAVVAAGGSVDSFRGGYVAQAAASSQGPSGDFAGPGGVRPAAAHDPEQTLTMPQTKRVTAYMLSMLDRLHPEIPGTYRIDIDRHQRGLYPLRNISGVDSIRPLDRVGEGIHRFRVVGRSIDGPVTTDIDLELSEHPKVAVPRTHFARLHVIKPGDLEMKPIPAEDLQDDWVTDAESIIGLQARANIRKGRPVSRDALGAPIAIHRGDKIEVRVIAGGVTVYVHAIAQDNGAESDLIQVQQRPSNKRMVARVVEPGLAEVVTRAPTAR